LRGFTGLLVALFATRLRARYRPGFECMNQALTAAPRPLPSSQPQPDL
jgi:hypothetical protein